MNDGTRNRLHGLLRCNDRLRPLRIRSDWNGNYLKANDVIMNLDEWSPGNAMCVAFGQAAGG